MQACQYNQPNLYNFRFHDVSDFELLEFFDAGKFSSDFNCLYEPATRNFIRYLNSQDDTNDNLFDNLSESKYFNEVEFLNRVQSMKPNHFSLIQFNAKSLYKNVDNISDY